jgi:hypothetical protein
MARRMAFDVRYERKSNDLICTAYETVRYRDSACEVHQLVRLFV